MRAYWLSGESLYPIWNQLSYAEAPFLEWDWWSTQALPWGALLIEEKGSPVAALPLPVRDVGFFRLYRQPLSVPYLSFRLKQDLPDSCAERYRMVGHILSAVAGWIKQQKWSYIAGSLPSWWSYLPPLRGLSVRGWGSFVIRAGSFAPSKELLRKVRQSQSHPLHVLTPQVGFEWWKAHRPLGISPKFVLQLEPLMRLSEAWWVLGVGDPLQAVGIFLVGAKRVWYVAGAHVGGSQIGTRLIYEAIQWSQAQGKDFDFQGSTLPGVERFFRQFGGEWELRYYLSACRVW
ncbi:MAG: hypothetical protein N3E49_08780 [Bacteroidia bacterium]|nr:hypothetical protein [Bacteroidia bacterium]